MWFIGVEVEQETSAPPPKKNPGSAPVATTRRIVWFLCSLPYVLRHSEHTKKLTVTTWNYTYK